MEDLSLSFRNPFTAPGRWYRGNLHTHTTGSDGLRSPEEAAAWYREQGYDFIALTDHYSLTPVEGLSRPGFLVLPGQEAHPGGPELADCYHLLALGISRSHPFGHEQGVQEAIDELRADGALVFLAHPYWSGLILPEMINLRGLCGVEVYNATCACHSKGSSAVHWDDLLGRGRLLWGLAVDDAHWSRPDYGQGWINVQALELTRAAILESLANGCFYASQGPEIYDIQLSESEVYVRCSPVSAVNCVSWLGWGTRADAPSESQLLTEVTFPRRKLKRYVRIECIDARGRCAWSQPLLLP